LVFLIFELILLAPGAGGLKWDRQRMGTGI